MTTTAIDNGYLLLSLADAQRLAGGRLPNSGYERLIEHEGRHYWLCRTVHEGRQWWALRPSGSWYLKDGVAVL